MWSGKKKAVTFSFDDGVMQDIRVIRILDRYGLKGTFNLNSGKFGTKHPYEASDKIVKRTLIEPNQVKELYKNHEVAVHTVGHFNLTMLPDSCVAWQVETDRKLLESLTDKPIRCMAYPCGGVNYDERVANIIKTQTKIDFARTAISSYSFDLQRDLLSFKPTIHFQDEKLFNLTEEFITIQSKEPALFYIWGHSYELDVMDGAWEKFEKFCSLIANRADVFYGTNMQVIFPDGD